MMDTVRALNWIGDAAQIGSSAFVVIYGWRIFRSMRKDEARHAADWIESFEAMMRDRVQVMEALQQALIVLKIAAERLDHLEIAVFGRAYEPPVAPREVIQ